MTYLIEAFLRECFVAIGVLLCLVNQLLGPVVCLHEAVPCLVRGFSDIHQSFLRLDAICMHLQQQQDRQAGTWKQGGRLNNSTVYLGPTSMMR